ncbi:MAG: hypothetical protein JW967_08895 [Dehalococcoidales bacterium]|nr:hypothetical protein [Dehalococcoidales bacterium]
MRILQLCKQIGKQQSGQILVISMIVVMLCSLVIIPLLNFMGTGLKTVSVYQENNELLYAADAGIQKGIWQIKYGDIPKVYDFTQTYPAETVNGNNVVVTIDYVWVLSGIADPVFGPHNDWIDVQTEGNPDITGVYTINLSYSDISGNPGNKKVDKMGVWLPAGFDYVAGSASDPAFPDNIKKTEPSVTRIHGGTSIKWTNVNYSFKNSGDVAYQKFRFTPVGELPKGDIAWVQSLSSDIGLSWDKMIWNYTITSVATDNNGKTTTVVAHVSTDTGATANIAVITYSIQ